MKIITEEKKISCPYCHTKLVYTQNDIKVVCITRNPYIECPVCKHRIFNFY